MTPTPAADRPRPLLRRAVSGMLWSYGSFLSARLLTLLATTLLARLLSPGEFGEVALALVLLALLETLSHLGLAQALVLQVRNGADDEAADTAFVATVTLSAAVALVIAASGGLAASFFGQPSLRTLMPVLAAALFLRALAYTHYALAQRDLAFRQRSTAEIGEVLVRGVTGVGLALGGLGAWSLVIGQLVGAMTFTALLWTLVPWRPRLRVRRAHLRRLAGFGSAVTGVDLLAAVITNVDYVVVGRTLGAGALGLYTLGFKVPELLVFSFALVADRVLFPVYAAVQRSELAAAVTEALRYVLLASMGCTVAVALLARPLIDVLFGDQWAGAVPAAQILALYALATALTIPAGSALKAIGRADVVLKIAVPWALTAVVLVVLAAPHGIAAVALAQTAAACLAAVTGLLVARPLLGLSLRAVFRGSLPALTAGGAMALVLWGIGRVGLGNLATLVAGGAAGSAVYAGVVLLLDREAVRMLADQLRRPASPAPSTSP